MRKLILAFFVVAAAGCSNGDGGSDASTDSPAGDGATGGCTTDLDCPSLGDHCYFPVNGGCTAAGRTGACTPYTVPATCATPIVACGCDGTTITECTPPGLVDRASMSAGACPPSDAGDDGSSDDGSSDALAE
ncbi:MAG TPA: hypothetical protein VGH28_14255 [Polyangiaceae bacterium]|jgi:hypothetical protein